MGFFGPHFVSMHGAPRRFLERSVADVDYNLNPVHGTFEGGAEISAPTLHVAIGVLYSSLFIAVARGVGFGSNASCVPDREAGSFGFPLEDGLECVA